MTQLIKPNDLVYIPSETKKVYEVVPHSDVFIVSDGDFRYYINAQGQRLIPELTSWSVQPFAFLATPENKEKLELVYGELEDIPVDKELEKFSKALNELSHYYANLYLSDGDVSPSKNKDELKLIKDKLIGMFKERGEK